MPKLFTAGSRFSNICDQSGENEANTWREEFSATHASYDMTREHLRAERKPKKVSFFGIFGQGNLGNESTLRAILHNLRQYLPDAEVNCICTGPQAAATIHCIATVPMHDVFVKPSLFGNNLPARLLRKILIGIPVELYRWIKAFRTLEGTDMLIVPGTQFLSDNLTTPFGWPYLAFKWAVVAKLRRCKLLFVSVGVGPLRHVLSRCFVKSALLLADFRSYRDDSSKEYLRHIGFDSTHDPVYPDLAFSLPMPTRPPRVDHSDMGTVVALGLKDFHGQYGRPLLQHEADGAYHRYIDNVTALLAWFLDHMYTVRLVIGDTTYDTPVLSDLKESLNAREFKSSSLHLIDEPIDSLEQLVSQLATSDIIVSPRYHNIVLGLLLNKPVLALSYHEKFAALLESSDLGRYNVDIDQLDLDTVIATFTELERNSEELTLQISKKVEGYRRVLDEQYGFIFRDLWLR